MNVMEYEHLKVTGDFEGYRVRRCEVCSKANSHARAEITLEPRCGTTLEEIQRAVKNPKISLYDTGNHVTLFAGKIQKTEISTEGGYLELNLWANSYSIDLDSKKRSRSFQDTGMTYGQLVKQVVQDEHRAIILCGNECEKPIGRIYIQYKETNWEFLKRIAGELGISLLVDMTKENPVIYMGTYDIVEEAEFNHLEYSYGISPLYYTSGGIERNLGKADFIFYDVKSYGNYMIGAKVTYKDGIFWICEKSFCLERGQICFSYRIGKKGLLSTRQYENERLIGVTLCGKVIKTERELLKIHLDIDERQQEETAFLFQWTPLSGNMMYCMPQVGTRVHVYFAEGNEDSAKVVSCVGEEQESISSGQGSSYRAFTSEHGKRMELTPDTSRFSTSGTDAGEKNEVALKDSLGMFFSSAHKVWIFAQGEIKLEGETISESGLTEVQMLQTGEVVSEASIQNPKADIEIAGNQEYFGENVYVEYHGKLKVYPSFEDAPQVGEFDGRGLFENIVFGVTVAVVAAAAIAVTASTLGAGAPFMAIFAAGVFGGAVGVGCLAWSDFSSGNVSEKGRYGIKGFTGALSGALAVACGPTAMSGGLKKYVLRCAATGAWTSAVGNSTEQLLENRMYGDKMQGDEFVYSAIAGVIFSGFAGALSYGITSFSQCFKNFSNLSDNKMLRKIWREAGIRPKNTLAYIQGVAKASGSKDIFATQSEALAWARQNARSMVMSLGGTSALTVALRTLGVEIPTSGLMSNFCSGVFLKEDTENSLEIVQKYIVQYGY